MNGLNRATIINAQFTAEQWGLILEDKFFDPSHYLNLYLNRFVNIERLDKNETRDRMHFEMGQFAEYGAADSEPIAFLERVLQEIFG